VTLDIECSGGEVVVTIEDEGGGFNPNSIPDPLAPENLLKPSGRGIHIMKSLMDKVDFTITHHGTRITMHLRIAKAS
jgi:serine/threonine-protein kinase RsbW